MERIVSAAAAALSFLALPSAALAQSATENQTPATQIQATPGPATETGRVTALLAGANENHMAALGMTLYGITAENTSLPNFSWGIPRSPALTLAGLADTKVPTSDSLRSFVVSLPNTLNNDEQGQAIALDATLAQLLSETGATELYRYRGQTLQEAAAISFHPGEQALGLAEQRRQRQARTSAAADGQTPDSYYQRWLRRSRIGIALYERVEDTSDASKNIPARLAIGFSTSLWDESDPVMQRGPQGGAFLEECQAVRTSELYVNEVRGLEGARTLDASTMHRVGAAAFLADLNSRAEPLRIQQNAAARFDATSISAYSNTHAFESYIHESEQALLRDGVMTRIALRATEDCAQRASKVAELRRDLDVGVGVLYRGDPGQVSDFDERGAAAWVAFRYPWGVNLISPDFGARLVDNEGDDRGNADSADPMANIDSYWLVAGSARFSQDEFIATGNDATPEIQVDQAEAWIGIERYSQRFRFGAFYGYSEVEAAEPAGEAFERSGERYVISAQYRLGDEEDSGLWIGLTYGDTGNAANADNDDALMFSINFAPQPAYTIDWDPDD